MTDQTILMLGKLIDDPSYGRDAIHIAVAPVIAAERLSPGQHVGLIGTDHAGRTDTPVGIVDPYLPAAVMKGDRFFLFLYPATITSLRHEWTHPAFTQQAANAFNGGGEYAPPRSEEEARAWLQSWSRRKYGRDFDASLIEQMTDFADGDRDQWVEDWDEQDKTSAAEIREFWRCFGIVTGRRNVPAALPRACCV